MKIINGVETNEADFLKKNTKLIWSVIKKFFPAAQALNIDRDDLFSEGSIGFIKAYRNFDESYGFQFSTYAVPKIIGEVQRFLRDKAGSVRFGRVVKELANKIYREGMEDLPVEEIAEKLGVTVEKVNDAFLSKYSVQSLEEPIQMSDNENVTLLDQVESKEDFSVIHVNEFLDALEPQDRKVMKLRLEGHDQSFIGKQIGLSQVQISRMLKSIGEKYRKFEEGELMAKPKLNMSVQEFLDMKYKRDMSIVAIAKEKGVTDPTVHNWIRKNKAEIDAAMPEKKTNPLISREKYDELVKQYDALTEKYNNQLVKYQELEITVKNLNEQQKSEDVDWKNKYKSEKLAHEYLFKYIQVVQREVV